MRTLIEFGFLIVFIWVARAILTSVLSGLKQAGQVRGGERPDAPLKGADLHKDPVCGTYVAESTPFQRQVGTQRCYYCSEECQDKHALVSH